MKKIKDLPSKDRPREKLLRKGPGPLSDRELLVIIPEEAGSVLGINLLDHIIFNRKGYYSFVENGEP